MNVGAADAIGINRVAGPIDKLDKPFYGKGLATSGWTVQDDRGREINSQGLVFLSIENDVDDVFVEKLL